MSGSGSKTTKKISEQMWRAGGWGAALYGGGTIVVTVSCSLVPVGENLIGLLLYFPWIVAYLPTCAVYRILGLRWDGEIGLLAFAIAVVLNSFLGFFIGAGLSKLWSFAKRVLGKRNDFKK